MRLNLQNSSGCVSTTDFCALHLWITHFPATLPFYSHSSRDRVSVFIVVPDYCTLYDVICNSSVCWDDIGECTGTACKHFTPPLVLIPPMYLCLFRGAVAPRKRKCRIHRISPSCSLSCMKKASRRMLHRM